MTSASTDTEKVEHLIESPDLAGALETERFKTFLDHVPIAIAVSELRDPEVIVYANPEFERVSDWGCPRLSGNTGTSLREKRSMGRMAFP